MENKYFYVAESGNVWTVEMGDGSFSAWPNMYTGNPEFLLADGYQEISVRAAKAINGGWPL